MIREADQSRGGYGLDIASVRFDELDFRVLAAIRLWSGPDDPRMLEIGCGSGRLAHEASRMGAIVTAIDALNNRRCDSKSVCRTRFLQASVPSFPPELNESRYDFVVSQRALHYLKYQDALSTLQWCRRHTETNGRLFLGVSGLASELAEDYEARHVCVTLRWSRLSPQMAEKHKIDQHVCLYTSSEIIELVSCCGFSVEDCWLSPFGNVKLIARTK